MLLASEQLGEVEAQLSGTGATEHDGVKALQHLLALQQQRDVGHEEAQEIAMSLIEFYELLAQEVQHETTC